MSHRAFFSARVLAIVAALAACRSGGGAPGAPGSDGAPDSSVIVDPSDQQTLKGSYADLFTIGTAVSDSHLTHVNDLLSLHFNRFTAENAMKFGPIHPAKDTFEFAEADRIADFARRRGAAMTGHTLVWHSQNPEWLFADLVAGDPESIATLKSRLQTHVNVMINRYGDVVDNWDVVNEAISDDGSKIYRDDSSWYRIFGDASYVYWGFRYAYEALETRAAGSAKGKLYYNDYNNTLKIDRILPMLKEVEAKGIPVTGVGFQAHWNFGFPSIPDLRKAMDAVVAAGYKIKISELDVSIYNDYPNGTYVPEAAKPFTDELAAQQSERYRSLFALFSEYKDHITSVTMWGVSDDQTWLDNFPVKGRNDHPLLWNDDHRAKPALDAVLRARKPVALRPQASDAPGAPLAVSRGPLVPSTGLRALADRRGMILGVAVNTSHLPETEYAGNLRVDYNAVVAENAMKMEVLQPAEGRFSYGEADELVRFATANAMQLRGHVLLWQNQVPEWARGKPFGQLLAVLRNHIDNVIPHFGSNVYAWDVANEVIKDDGSGLRNRQESGSGFSIWAQTATDESLIREAFYRADAVRRGHGIATKLFLCDYATESKGQPKAERFYNMVERMVRDGVPIDGVAFEMHLSLRFGFDASAIQQTIDRFRALRLQVHFSEVDVRFDFADGVTADELNRQASIYRSLMDLYKANRDVVTSFLIWGVTDKYSWLPADWTPEGKPLLLNDTYGRKPAYHALDAALR
jgi:endo-1,4-beta-xylanase